PHLAGPRLELVLQLQAVLRALAEECEEGVWDAHILSMYTKYMWRAQALRGGLLRAVGVRARGAQLDAVGEPAQQAVELLALRGAAGGRGVSAAASGLAPGASRGGRAAGGLGRSAWRGRSTSSGRRSASPRSHSSAAIVARLLRSMPSASASSAWLGSPST